MTGIHTLVLERLLGDFLRSFGPLRLLRGECFLPGDPDFLLFSRFLETRLPLEPFDPGEALEPSESVE